MTARETAEALGINERTVRRAIADGRLPARKRAGAFVIDLDTAREALRGVGRRPRDDDAEMRALRSLAEHLEPLPQDVRGRVLRWAVDKFDAAVA